MSQIIRIYLKKNCIFDYYSLIEGYKIRFSTCHVPMKDVSECDYLVGEKVDSESIEGVMTNDYTLLHTEEEVRNYRNVFKDGLQGFELVHTIKIRGGDSSFFIYKKANVVTGNA